MLTKMSFATVVPMGIQGHHKKRPTYNSMAREGMRRRKERLAVRKKRNKRNEEIPTRLRDTHNF